MTSRDYRKSLTWGKRLIMVVLILGGLFYGTLILAAKNKDTVRLGFQDYLQQITGERAEITDLADLQFVPDLTFALKGILIRDKIDPQKTLITAEHAYISMPFWRMMFGMNTYLGFEIKKLQMASGFYLPAKLDANIIGITDTRPQRASPMFLIDGTYNNLSLLITAEMIRRNKGGKALYSFEKEFPVTFKLGALEGGGTLVRGSHAAIKDMVFTRGEQNASFTITDFGSNPLSFDAKGTINGVNFNAELTKSGEDRLLKISPENPSLENIKKNCNIRRSCKKRSGNR